MSWDVQLYDAFDAEFEDLPEAIQDELLAHARLLEVSGPQLGRPRVDTLNGSKHANMKELRFNADDGVWRVALPSIRSAKPFSWFAAINQVAAKSDSISDLSRKRMSALMTICPGCRRKAGSERR